MNCDGFDFTHIEKKQIDWSGSLFDLLFLIENIDFTNIELIVSLAFIYYQT